MLRAWKIGRFFGIDLYVHWSFLLLPLWAVLNQPRDTPVGTPLLLGVMFAVFGCVVLHEYGHALVARHFGIGTRDITLYPIGGVARLERISEKPWEEFWIAIGGPAVNVVILILLGLLGVALALIQPGLVGHVVHGEVVPTTVGFFLAALFFGNLILVLFNMAPAFPMDGGRVFRAVLSMWVGHLRATRIAARVGLVVALFGGAALAILWSSPWVLIIALFVLMAGQQELRYVEWRHSQEMADQGPIPVVPVQPLRATAQAFTPLNGLLFQPRVSVYVWDSRTGTWVKEGGSPPPRFNEG
jgi:Zn-dependent protease